MISMGYKPRTNNTCGGSDRHRLLNEIGKIDFVLKELNLYLDTHPYDQQTIAKFNQYNNLKNNLVAEYTQEYGPIVLSAFDSNSTEWKWATQDWPWSDCGVAYSSNEGGYY
jgi:spore coat protein JB